MTDKEVRQLASELQTHQIELELQAEDLRQAQVALSESRDRYTDLYDFAPVGFVSQDKEGGLFEVNLAAAALLGVARGDLIGANINKFLKSYGKAMIGRPPLDSRAARTKSSVA